MTEVDIAIVGAGAAGLGAAARLAGTGASFVVLEAQGRVGGRAHTVPGPGGAPLDLGCAWLHSADRNPLVPRFAAQGWTIDKTPPPWNRPAGDLGPDPEDLAAFGEAFAAFEARLEAAAATGRDAPASDFLESGGRWNARLNGFSAYYNGAEFDQVSVLDYAAYDDDEVNWRVAQGYGAAVAAQAERDRVWLDCPVSVVRHDGPRLALDTARGSLSARTAVICVSTAVLARERLRFEPGLPDKLDAAHGLPLGLADKVFLTLDGVERLPEDVSIYGHPDRTATGAYHLRPLGRPVIEAFFGGRHARALEAEGPGASTAFAIAELSAALGSGLGRRLTPLAATAWGADPFVLGSYSHALPGRAGDRARLAAPVEDRLFFAGEACSAHAFSTAHGAWETGVAATEAALAALG